MTRELVNGRNPGSGMRTMLQLNIRLIIIIFELLFKRNTSEQFRYAVIIHPNCRPEHASLVPDSATIDKHPSARVC